MSTCSSNIGNDPASKENPTWFFHGPSGTTRRDIWKWWQQRRVRYNRDLFSAGIVSWSLVLFAGSASVEPGQDFAEPFAMIFGPLIYGIFANLSYTGGPIMDTVFYQGSPRRGLFRTGYVFSLVLTGLPGALAILAWLITVFSGSLL